MISLKASTFLSNRSVCVARRRVSPVKVYVGSNGRATEQNGVVLVESPLKEIKEVASVVEVLQKYSCLHWATEASAGQYGHLKVRVLLLDSFMIDCLQRTWPHGISIGGFSSLP